MDWKDSLEALKGVLPEGDAPEQKEETPTHTDALKQRGVLHVLLDKKGRKGKTATIVEGFELPDKEVASIAATLKQRLGTGGSSRGGEILIQGDKRTQVVEVLRTLGFKAKQS